MRYVTTLLLSVVIFIFAGCSNQTVSKNDNVPTTSPDSQTTAQLNTPHITEVAAKPGQPSKQPDISSYFQNIMEDSVVYKDDHWNVWKSGRYSVKARIKQVDIEGPESRVIESMTVQNGDKTFNIKTANQPLYISSLMPSPDKKYLAVSVFRGGNILFLINLDNGEHIVLNDEIAASRKETVTSIGAFSWSPDSRELAFSYGDEASSRIAIYSLRDQSFRYVPTPASYITTAHVLWSKNAQTLDFVSEYPSDQYKLYRFDRTRNTVSYQRDVSLDDVNGMFNFNTVFLPAVDKVKECGTVDFGKGSQKTRMTLRCIRGTYGSDEDQDHPRLAAPEEALEPLPYSIPSGLQDQLDAYWMNQGDNKNGILLLAPKEWIVSSAEVGANGSTSVRLENPEDGNQFVDYFDNGGCQGCLISNIGAYFPSMQNWADNQGFPAHNLPEITERSLIDPNLMAYKKKPSAEGYEWDGVAYQEHGEGGGFFLKEEVQLKNSKQDWSITILDWFGVYSKAKYKLSIK